MGHNGAPRGTENFFTPGDVCKKYFYLVEDPSVWDRLEKIHQWRLGWQSGPKKGPFGWVEKSGLWTQTLGGAG